MNKATEIMTIIIFLSLIHGVSKKKVKNIYAMDIFMVMYNYFTTFTLYSLYLILWDTDPEIVASLRRLSSYYFQ